MGVALVLLVVMAILPGWIPASPEAQAPPGCSQVFAATTRGGAQLPKGGGCNLFRRDTGDTRVVRIIDGDTIQISGDRRVRYIGIDTPEMRPSPEPLALEATLFNEKLLRDGRVRLEKDVSETDRFDRLLRYVYTDGILVNAELVREGYATAVSFHPDLRYVVCFQALEEEARAAGRGMWAP